VKIAVVTAGLNTPSSTRVLADALVAATRRRLAPDGTAVQFDIIELRELAHAVVDNLLTGFPSPALKQAIDQVTGADGLIAVTPIFNGSYSGLFKAFFDVLSSGAIAGKPVLMGATGGTERHSLALDYALRPLFSYLGAHVVPTAVYAASSDFGATDRGAVGLGPRVERAAEQFTTLVRALDRRQVDDPFADPVPFEHLLAGRPDS
jgi:FMN reductase